MRNRVRWAARALMPVAVLVAPVGCQNPGQPDLPPVAPTERVTPGSAGAYVGTAISVSRSGDVIAFATDGGDLGPADTNRTSDVYVKDLRTGALTLASVDAAGTDAGNGRSEAPAVSPDGTKVAFISTARDLGPDDPGTNRDVYVRDLVAGTTTAVTADATGRAVDAFRDDEHLPSDDRHLVFSPDGTRLAFSTAASLVVIDPTRPDTVNQDDVYVRDLGAGAATLVSVNAGGTAHGNDPSAGAVAFSPDGDRLLFKSLATDLETVTRPAPTANTAMYVRDLRAGRTTLAIPNASGTGPSDGFVEDLAFAGDDALVFTSDATDLGPRPAYCAYKGLPGPCPTIFRRDLRRGVTTLVSTNYTGLAPPNNYSWHPRVSPDGTKVLFESTASDIEYGTTNGGALHVRDLTSGTTTIVSPGPDGRAPQGFYRVGGWDPSGTRITYSTTATFPRLIDANGAKHDVFVYDRVSRRTHIVSANAAGTATGNGESLSPVFVDGGRRVAYLSGADDLVAGDDNGRGDLFVGSIRPLPTS